MERKKRRKKRRNEFYYDSECKIFVHILLSIVFLLSVQLPEKAISSSRVD